MVDGTVMVRDSVSLIRAVIVKLPQQELPIGTFSKPFIFR